MIWYLCAYREGIQNLPARLELTIRSSHHSFILQIVYTPLRRHFLLSNEGGSSYAMNYVHIDQVQRSRKTFAKKIGKKAALPSDLPIEAQQATQSNVQATQGSRTNGQPTGEEGGRVSAGGLYKDISPNKWEAAAWSQIRALN